MRAFILLLALAILPISGTLFSTPGAMQEFASPTPQAEADDPLPLQSWRGGLVALDGRTAIIGTDRDQRVEFFDVLEIATGIRLWGWAGTFGSLIGGNIYASEGDMVSSLDAWTGQATWQSQTEGVVTSVAVFDATPSVVYVVSEESIAALNIATGAEYWHIAKSSLGTQGNYPCRYVDLSGATTNSVLISTSCGVQTSGSGETSLVALDNVNGLERWRVPFQPIFGVSIKDTTGSQVLVSNGTQLFAYDAETGELRWRHDGTIKYRDEKALLLFAYWPFEPNVVISIALVDRLTGHERWSVSGEVFLAADSDLLATVQGDGIVSGRDLATGDIRWRVQAAVRGVNTSALDGDGLTVFTDGGRNASKTARRLDRETGALLWERSLGGKVNDGPFQVGSVIVASVGEGTSVFDLATGDVRWEASFETDSVYSEFRVIEAISDGRIFERVNSLVVVREISSGELLWTWMAGDS